MTADMNTQMMVDGTLLAHGLVTATLNEDVDTVIALLHDVPLEHRPVPIILARELHRLIQVYAEEIGRTPADVWSDIATQWVGRVDMVAAGQDPDA